MYLNPKRLEIHKDKVEVHFVKRSQENVCRIQLLTIFFGMRGLIVARKRGQYHRKRPRKS